MRVMVHGGRALRRRGEEVAGGGRLLECMEMTASAEATIVGKALQRGHPVHSFARMAS